MNGSPQRVAVLRGGPSAEYDISLITGEGVLAALDRKRYEPVDVVITKSGAWLANGKTRTPEEILNSIDVVFIALHGAYGEDGTVQRLMDRLNVPYTGSKAFPSAIAMNKHITKAHLKPTGIKMPRHMIVDTTSKGKLTAIVTSISELFGPRYVVKPVASGSSVGVELVENVLLLHGALRRALEVYDHVIVEECIAGKEATCGVINDFRNQQLYALPPIEIIPPKGANFFDRTVKYDGSTEEICPGRFSREVKAELERLAKLVHETLELSQYSRSDFIVGDDGHIYFLEVNTLPGMTPQSLMPKGLIAVGATYEEFVEHLIGSALNR